MNPASFILVFVITWWMVFFTMLPVGVRSQHEEGDTTVPGSDPSAPTNPALRKKALWTTCITAILTAIYYWLSSSGIIAAQFDLPY